MRQKRRNDEISGLLSSMRNNVVDFSKGRLFSNNNEDAKRFEASIKKMRKWKAQLIIQKSL